jgi:twitching motility protein PilT
MQTLDQHMLDLVKKGIVSRLDARSRAQNKEAFSGT